MFVLIISLLRAPKPSRGFDQRLFCPQAQHRGRKPERVPRRRLARRQLHLAQVLPAGHPQVVHQQRDGENLVAGFSQKRLKKTFQDVMKTSSIYKVGIPCSIP